MTQYLGNALIKVIALVNGQSVEVSPLTPACKESLGIDGERRALQEANGDDRGLEETPTLPKFQIFSPDGTQIIDIDGNSGSDSNSDGTGSSGGTQAPTPTPRKPIYETVDEIDIIVKDTDGKVDGIQDVLTPMKTTVDGMSDTIGTKINATVAPIETSVSNTESAVNFMRGEVNDIKEQVQEIHEINALMHEILNRTLAPTLSPSQSPSRSVSCNVVPFVFHTQYIPHFY